MLGWRRSIERLTAWAAGFVASIELAVIVVALSGTDETSTRALLSLAAGGQVTLVVAVLAAGLRRPVRASLAIAAAGVVLVCTSTIDETSGVPAFAEQLLPVNGVQAVLVAVIAVGLPVRWGSVLVAASGPAYVGLRAWMIDEHWADAIDEWILAGGTAAAILVVLGYLRAGAGEADRLAAVERGLAEERQAALLAEQAADDARRVLHDDVISALHAIELGLDEERVERAAVRAVEAVRVAVGFEGGGLETAAGGLLDQRVGGLGLEGAGGGLETAAGGLLDQRVGGLGLEGAGGGLETAVDGLLDQRVGGSSERVRGVEGSARFGGSERLRGVVQLPSLSQRLRGVVPLSVEIDESRWVVEPPVRVVDALVGAAGEALRNAHRHGGATTAWVELVAEGAGDVVSRRLPAQPPRPPQVSVRVVDDGVGLGAGAVPGFGITQSIEARMRDVGGRGTVGPAADGPGAGRGVAVELVWPAPVELADLTAEPLLADRRRVSRPLALLTIAITAYLAVRHPGEPVLAALTLLGVVGLVGVACRIAETSRPATRTVLGYGVASAGVIVLGLAAAGPGALLSEESWVIGGVADATAVLAFQARARWVVMVIAAQVATVLAAAGFEPGMAMTAPVGALVTPVVVGGFGLLLGVGLRRDERRLAAGRAAVAAGIGEGRDDSAWVEAQAAARRVHLAHLEDDVVPFLLAGGRDPAEAHLLALRCRDDLALTLDPETRVALERARRRGVRVTIRVPSAVPFDPATWPVVREVVDGCADDDRVTVLPPDGERPGRVSVVGNDDSTAAAVATTLIP